MKKLFLILFLSINFINSAFSMDQEQFKAQVSLEDYKNKSIEFYTNNIFKDLLELFFSTNETEKLKVFYDEDPKVKNLWEKMFLDKVNLALTEGRKNNGPQKLTDCENPSIIDVILFFAENIYNRYNYAAPNYNIMTNILLGNEESCTNKIRIVFFHLMQINQVFTLKPVGTL